MAAYRTGFGTGNFGVRAFGVDGEVTDAIGSGTLVSTVVTSAEVVKLGSASSTTSSTTGSPTGEYIVDASASTSCASGTHSSGEVIYLSSAVSTSSTTSSASIQFVTNAESSVSATSSVAASALRVPIGSSTVNAQSAFSADAFITANVSAEVSSIGVLSDMDGVGYRVREASANAMQGVSIFASVSGREKWEPIAPASTTWTNVA